MSQKIFWLKFGWNYFMLDEIGKCFIKLMFSVWFFEKKIMTFSEIFMFNFISIDNCSDDNWLVTCSHESISVWASSWIFEKQFNLFFFETVKCYFITSFCCIHAKKYIWIFYSFSVENLYFLILDPFTLAMFVWYK